jgi:hypothetical protein
MMMFLKEEFNYSGGYLTYQGKFIARFKYIKDHNQFKNFLIRNFTQTEYFERLANGESPLGVLGSKGYVPSHVKKYLKNNGYEPTIAGMKMWSQDSVAQFNKENARA